MRKIIVLSLIILTITAVMLNSAEIKMAVSGPGVINDSTLKVGEKVSFDIYVSNEIKRTGFTFGFAVKSPDIKTVVHVSDSGNGLNDNGDVKGYNGWQDNSIWDFAGVFAVERDWDGNLPELLGFGGLSIKKSYDVEELSKKLSMEMIIPESGTLVIDSAWYPPGGKWVFSSPPRIAPEAAPEWFGPYKYSVVK
ncbi:MAG: hypothetical protein DRP35_00350 [Candidatus Zixiibacteriota bacterium]|nr:MAG: hypothetical protein DRP35_00350 [candidate division Zixibacteria bacterium]